MAERYNTYYRASWPVSGMLGPILTKKQLMNEIEVSLLNLGSEVDKISVVISKIEMTHSQFTNRSENDKNYGYEGTMQ
jgi:hypothetical protein